VPKYIEKEKAIRLRKKGLTYSEILRQVPVAKSTLSLWLREVGISGKQKQRLTKKKHEASMRGGQARREQRIARTKEIHRSAKKDINRISQRELWLIGIALYWAEGAKEKERKNGSSQVDFGNTDARMVKFYLKWLIEACNVKQEDINFSIYIHENSVNRINEVVRHWSTCTGFKKDRITYIYFKKHNTKTKRKNIGKTYFGVLRVKVRKSTELNRKIAGWVQGIDESLF